MSPPDRRASDTPRSYAALCDLAAMGPGRSLEKYRLTTGKSPAYLRQLERWSSDHDWMARLVAYDTSVVQSDDAARASVRAQRRAALEEADWQTGSDLRARCAELLAEMPRFLRRTEVETRQNGELVKIITLALKAGPGELARALETASKIQRLSVGEATEIHKQVESELEKVLDKLQSQLSPEDYARVVVVIAGETPD